MSKGDMGRLPGPARRALAAYRERLAPPDAPGGPAVAWAPGRVNLIGEHTDYNLGLVLPAAIDRVVALAGRATGDGRAALYSQHHDERAAFALTPEALLGAAPAGLPPWARYVRAVLAEWAALDGAALPAGLAAAIAGDIPVGGGMSSSAALEVASATLAAALGAGPALGPMATARLCRRAEERAVGVRVGIMDQATSCLGRAGHAILLDCRSLDYEYIPAPLEGAALVVFDTGVPRTLAETGYNERRAQCEEAAGLLARAIAAAEPGRVVASLRDVTAGDLARYGATLPELLLRRARHVVSENARVMEAADALRVGDLARLGALLDASHASLCDDYAVSCAELDAAVEIARGVPGAWGARLMGAGFGGSALMMARRSAVGALRAALGREYPARTGRAGTVYECRIADGPRGLRVDDEDDERAAGPVSGT